MDPQPRTLPPTPSPDPTLHHPRILCLHGGGTNARIFRTQCRALSAHLRPHHFRLVFAEAPFPSRPGPDVLSVYRDWGPFRQWVRVPGSSDADADAQEAVGRALVAAMEGDDAVGGTGEWVALLGFSQGAKLAASLLLMLQRRAAKGESFRFGVLMAGRAPLIALEPGVVAWPPGSGEEWKDGGGGGDGGGAATPLLRVPTIHVHGMRDPGLEMHVELLRLCCERGSARLVEWDGEHRLPIKTKDVLPVVEQILAVAKETGVLV